MIVFKNPSSVDQTLLNTAPYVLIVHANEDPMEKLKGFEKTRLPIVCILNKDPLVKQLSPTVFVPSYHFLRKGKTVWSLNQDAPDAFLRKMLTLSMEIYDKHEYMCSRSERVYEISTNTYTNTNPPPVKEAENVEESRSTHSGIEVSLPQH